MKIEIFNSLEQITPAQWLPLAPPEFPFASYDFILALEQTGCLGRRTGWSPHYICAFENEKLLGAFLVFAKTNSYGEYIFDFAWAQAFESYGLAYYPKFTAAIPFTPATGPKILLAQSLSQLQQKETASLLLNSAKELCKKSGASSLHALFISEKEISDFKESQFLIRHSFQYHWLNHNYQSFEDFLTALRKKRRKEILRERKQAATAGVRISRLTGSDLNAGHAKAMYSFYSSTVAKMGGHDYLTEDFFLRVFDRLKDNILLVLAENSNGEPIAGALNYFGDSTLFGRHWGCLEEYKSLHFELCYYQGIEFAIEKKLTLFEAGAQGEHKFQRGFMPRLTYSAHQILNPQFSEAIKNYVEAERHQLELMFADYERQTPFSRAGE